MEGFGPAIEFPLNNLLLTTTMSSEKVDLLVLGATGFTGGLIVRYLAAHPQRQHFSLAIGGRSPRKLQEVVKKLNLASDVKIVEVDVTKEEEAERAVKGAKVVINAVGPYWLYGTPTLRSVRGCRMCNVQLLKIQTFLLLFHGRSSVLALAMVFTTLT